MTCAVDEINGDVIRIIGDHGTCIPLLWTCTALSRYLRPRWQTEILLHAAANGYLNILKWARSFKCRWSMDVCNYAAVGDHRNVLEWVRDSARDDNWIPASDSQSVHWDMLHKMCSIYYKSYMLEYAADVGDLQIIQMVIDTGIYFKSSIWSTAARNRYLHILQWALIQGLAFCQDLGRNISECGDMKCVQWLLEDKYRYDLGNSLSQPPHHEYVQLWLGRNGAFTVLQNHVVDATDCHPSMKRYINIFNKLSH